MKTGTIDLAVTTYIPDDGIYESNNMDDTATIELHSDDIPAAIAVELQGSLSGQRWDTLQESGTDISLTLTPGETLVRTFRISRGISLRLKCPAGTGVIKYLFSN